MDEQTRKAWSRPELIVIVRSGSQEAVLAGCKNSFASAPVRLLDQQRLRQGLRLPNSRGSLSGS